MELFDFFKNKKGIVLIIVLFIGVSTVVSRLYDSKLTAHTELTISAASSLKNSLSEIAVQFEASHPDIHLTFNFGSSGSLASQIQAGAPVDLFISASKKQIESLTEAHLIDSKDVIELLSNQLVFIIPNNNTFQPRSLNQLSSDSIRSIAIGQPDSVPAGQYAIEALQNAKLYAALQQKLLYAKDVKQVLSYVERGDADAGIVYLSDASASKSVQIAFPIDSSLHAPIIYPLAIISSTKHPIEAKLVSNYFNSTIADNVFTKYRFTLR